MTSPLPTREEIDRFVGAAHGDAATVRAFLDAHPGHVSAPSSAGETALQAAAHTGQRAIAELLLDRGAELDLATAAMLGRNGEVRRMLEADPARAHEKGAHGIPAAVFPALVGNVEALQLLAAHGADVSAGAGLMTALHASAMAGQPGAAAWLLEHGARPDATDHSGKTPLQVAEQLGRAEVAELLRRVAQPA